MDTPLKNVYIISLGITYTTYHILGTKHRRLPCVRLSKLVQFQIHSPLNILTLPDWLNVKFHYFLIGSKLKILNTLTPLAPIYVTLFPAS